MFRSIKKCLYLLLISMVNASNHAKCELLAIGNVRLSLLLLIYILMNTFKNFTTIHLRSKRVQHDYMN